MVDVSAKAITCREAIASALVQTTPEVIALLQTAMLKKGDALACARIAGIMAAKKTSDLIPLCHPLALTQVDIQFSLDQVLRNGSTVHRDKGLLGAIAAKMHAASDDLLADASFSEQQDRDPALGCLVDHLAYLQVSR